MFQNDNTLLNLARSACALLALLFFVLPTAYASQLLDENRSYPIGEKLEFAQDETGNLQIQDILNGDFMWEHPLGEVPSFGFTSDVYWFRLKIDVGEGVDDDWILSHEWAAIRELRVYWVLDGTIDQSFVLSNQKPFAERPINHRYFLAPLKLTPGQTGELYLRIESANGVQAPMDLAPRDGFFLAEEKETVIHGIFFGIVLVMVFYNLSVYLAFRDPNYILYVLFIGIFGVLQANFLGYSFQYLWPAYPDFHERAMGILVSMALVSGGTFVSRFLHLAEFNKKLADAMMFFVSLSLIVFVLAFFIPPVVATAIAAGLALPIVTIAFTSGVQTWLVSGSKPAMYFVIAWAIFLLSVLAFALQKFGMVSHNNWSEYMIEAGHAIQVTLLSFALAERINETRRATIEAQARALDKEREMADFQKEALTREKAISGDLEVALGKAEEAYRVKSEFLAGISHELRTPLNAIVNVPNIILGTYEVRRFWHCEKCGSDFEDPELSPDIEPHNSETCPECSVAMVTDTDVVDTGELKTHFLLLNRAKTSGNYLLRIINDLLDISKLEAGKMLISPEFTNVPEIFEEVFATLTDLATSKGLTLDKELLDDVQVCYADPVKLGQILVNLVGNAIKFTDEGSVMFRVKKCVEESDMLRFEVQDTGIGIPKAAQDLVFESFRQADGSHTRRHGGTGLGLAISRELVVLHHGELELSSVEGEGTTFSFTLPADMGAFVERASGAE